MVSAAGTWRTTRPTWRSHRAGAAGGALAARGSRGRPRGAPGRCCAPAATSAGRPPCSRRSGVCRGPCSPRPARATPWAGSSWPSPLVFAGSALAEAWVRSGPTPTARGRSGTSTGSPPCSCRARSWRCCCCPTDGCRRRVAAAGRPSCWRPRACSSRPGCWCVVRRPHPTRPGPPGWPPCPNPVGVLPVEPGLTRSADLEWLLQLPLLLCLAAVVVRLRRADPGGTRPDRGAAPGDGGLRGRRRRWVARSGRRWRTSSTSPRPLSSAVVLVVRRAPPPARRCRPRGVTTPWSTPCSSSSWRVGTSSPSGCSTRGRSEPLARSEPGVAAAAAALAVLPLRSLLQRFVDRVMTATAPTPTPRSPGWPSRSHAGPTSTEVLAAVAGSVAASLRVRRGCGSAPTELTRRATARRRARRSPAVAVALAVTPQIGHPRGRRYRPGRRLRSRTRSRCWSELGRHAGMAVDAVHLAERGGRAPAAASSRPARRSGGAWARAPRRAGPQPSPASPCSSVRCGHLVRTDPGRRRRTARRAASRRRPGAGRHPPGRPRPAAAGARPARPGRGLAPASRTRWACARQVAVESAALPGGGGAGGVPDLRRGADEREPHAGGRRRWGCGSWTRTRPCCCR